MEKNMELETCIKTSSPFIPLETNYEYIISKLIIPNVQIYDDWASQDSLIQFTIVKL